MYLGYIICFQPEMSATLQTCLLIQTVFLIALLQVWRIQEREFNSVCVWTQTENYIWATSVHFHMRQTYLETEVSTSLLACLDK